MPVAQIVNVRMSGSFEGQHGLMFNQDITLSDGVVGVALTKSAAAPYGVGDSVVYEITGQRTNGQNKLKIKKEEATYAPTAGAGGRPTGSTGRPPRDSTGQTVGCAAHCVSRMVAAGVIPLDEFGTEVLRVTRALLAVEKRIAEAGTPTQPQTPAQQAPAPRQPLPANMQPVQPLPQPPPPPPQRQPAPPVDDDFDEDIPS